MGKVHGSLTRAGMFENLAWKYETKNPQKSVVHNF